MGGIITRANPGREGISQRKENPPGVEWQTETERAAFQEKRKHLFDGLTLTLTVTGDYSGPGERCSLIITDSKPPQHCSDVPGRRIQTPPTGRQTAIASVRSCNILISSE